MATINEIGDNGPDGTRLGKSATSSLVSFFAKTPIVQPTSANQAEVISTAPVSVSATQWAFTTSTQALSILTFCVQLRTDLVNLGLIKGS